MTREALVTSLQRVPLTVLTLHGLLEVVCTLASMSRLPKNEKLTKSPQQVKEMCDSAIAFFISQQPPSGAARGTSDSVKIDEPDAAVPEVPDNSDPW